MAASGALGGVGAGLLRVEVVAADAVEGDVSALMVVEGPVAPVVVEPQEAEHTQHQQAVENDIEGEIRRRDHGRKFTQRREDAKGKEKRAGGEASALRVDLNGASAITCPTLRLSEPRRRLQQPEHRRTWLSCRQAFWRTAWPHPWTSSCSPRPRR